MSVSQQKFRDAAARLGAAVSVITSAGPSGRCGFTASAVCSVTDAPPTLLVCMNRSSQQHDAFRLNRTLCVNVLASNQHELSALFAGQLGIDVAERFEATEWTILATGAPALNGAAVNIDCSIREVVACGTHSIFLAEVEMVRLGADEVGGLIWFGRSYHGVGSMDGST
jgi:flavin reductase